tara:strand:+ start:337 stop:945 length:609 start_codon:yes stop_codon:yes gene_type:complete
VGNNQFPQRNPNYLSVPMYIPGYRPGEISEHEIQLRKDGASKESDHLAANTAYLNSWSDIITFAPGTTSSYQKCTGPFPTPNSFLSLLQQCESSWSIGNNVLNSGTNSRTMSFEIVISSLLNGSNELSQLQFAVLTVDKISPEKFTFSKPTLVDFASGDEGVSQATVQTKTSSIQLYSSSCSQVDPQKHAACISEINYIRTR